MQKFNKKGLSEVVTAILVILLVLVAISIIWVVVSRFMNQGAAEIGNSADCALIQLSITSAQNLTTNQYSIGVSRGTGGPANVEKVKLFFTNDTATEQEESAAINLAEVGTANVAVLHNALTMTSRAKTVRVSPILANGNLCEPKMDPVAITNA